MIDRATKISWNRFPNDDMFLIIEMFSYIINGVMFQTCLNHFSEWVVIRQTKAFLMVFHQHLCALFFFLLYPNPSIKPLLRSQHCTQCPCIWDGMALLCWSPLKLVLLEGPGNFSSRLIWHKFFLLLHCKDSTEPLVKGGIYYSLATTPMEVVTATYKQWDQWQVI